VDLAMKKVVREATRRGHDNEGGGQGGGGMDLTVGRR
jgi:hypothetical protein